MVNCLGGRYPPPKQQLEMLGGWNPLPGKRPAAPILDYRFFIRTETEISLM